MPHMWVFPYMVALLDLGAAVVYVYNKQWALGITWFFYACACVSLGSVK